VLQQPVVDDHQHHNVTTVRQPIKELGTVAFEPLFAMIKRERPASRDVVLPTVLVRRESCGRALDETRLRER
jgi:DNA-binding LacI/PurR family transcriptional regulator